MIRVAHGGSCSSSSEVSKRVMLPSNTFIKTVDRECTAGAFLNRALGGT